MKSSEIPTSGRRDPCTSQFNVQCVLFPLHFSAIRFTRFHDLGSVKPQSRSSQHEKRKRLDTPNPQRKKTVKATVPLTGAMADLVKSMAGMLDARMVT